jgi:hypothetical protein
MKIHLTAWRWLGLALLSLTVFTAGVVVSARSGGLTAGEARGIIAKMPGFELSRDAVRVKEVNAIGDSAVVVAQVETAFKLEKDSNGKWRVAEVRTGDNRWQSVDELAASLSEEKAAVAQAEMETVANSLENFKRARGFYVAGETVAELMDHLQPNFICRVIRLDPWHHPYAYSGTATSFSLRSAGPDGKLDTADDIPYAGK